MRIYRGIRERNDTFTATNFSYWAIGTAAGALLALASRGLAGDEEAVHYLLARYAPEHVENWIGLAGRPLVTAALALPSQAGLLGARLASAAALGLAAWAVARAARHLGGPAPVWAVFLFLLQPFLLAHGGTAMTEPWSAALLAWGLVATIERRSLLLTAIAASLPLARAELAIFWLPAAIFLWYDRRRRWIALLPLPLLAWHAAGVMTSGDWLWLPRHLIGPEYSPRHPLHYARSMAWTLGPGVLVPCMVGIVHRAARERERARAVIKERGSARRAELAALAMLVTLVALYTALASAGPGTGGNLRYMALAAPAAALLASAGLRTLLAPMGPATMAALGLALLGAVTLWSHPYHRDQLLLERRDLFVPATVAAWAIAAILRGRRYVVPALGVALALLGLLRDHRSLILRSPTEEERAVAAAAQWMREHNRNGGVVYSAHPLLALALGRDPYDRALFPGFAGLSEAPGGALLFWDSHYAPVRAPDAFLRGAGTESRPPATPSPDPAWSFRAGFAAPDTTWAGAFYRKGDAADASAEARWQPLFRSAWTGVPYARAAAQADPHNPARWRELARRLAMAGRLDEARAAARAARVSYSRS